MDITSRLRQRLERIRLRIAAHQAAMTATFVTDRYRLPERREAAGLVGYVAIVAVFTVGPLSIPVLLACAGAASVVGVTIGPDAIELGVVGSTIAAAGAVVAYMAPVLFTSNGAAARTRAERNFSRAAARAGALSTNIRLLDAHQDALDAIGAAPRQERRMLRREANRIFDAATELVVDALDANLLDVDDAENARSSATIDRLAVAGPAAANLEVTGPAHAALCRLVDAHVAELDLLTETLTAEQAAAAALAAGDNAELRQAHTAHRLQALAGQLEERTVAESAVELRAERAQAVAAARTQLA